VIKRIALAVAALVLVGGGAYWFFFVHGDSGSTANAKPKSTASAQALSSRNITFLEEHISSPTLKVERQALDPAIRDALATPMFPHGDDLKIDAKTFKVDSHSDNNAATVEATTKTYGRATLILAREGKTWYLVSTEVK
jgi:hypothetical protein